MDRGQILPHHPLLPGKKGQESGSLPRGPGHGHFLHGV